MQETVILIHRLAEKNLAYSWLVVFIDGRPWTEDRGRLMSLHAPSPLKGRQREY